MKNPSLTLPFIALTWLLATGNVAQAESHYVAPDLTGTVVDALTKQPLSYAVIQASWIMRAEDEAKSRTSKPKAKRLYARQINSGQGGRFELPGWIRSMESGWQLIPGQDPIVRIYASGYRRLTLENRIEKKHAKLPASNPADAQKWRHESAVLALKPLADTTDALVTELTLWKRDLETEIEQSPSQNRNEAIRKQERLLFLFDDQCKTLPEAKRNGLCYNAESEFGRYLVQALAERLKYLTVEERDGEIKKFPLKIEAAPAPVAAPSRAGAAPSSKRGYSGISRPGVSEPSVKH